MITVTFVRQLPRSNSGASRMLWRLSEPLPEHNTEYVVTSGVTVIHGVPETYIFPTDDQGEVLDWGELPGSFQGGIGHLEALIRAGWSIAPAAPA